VGNHFVSPNVTYREARERLMASRYWKVTDNPSGDTGLRAEWVGPGVEHYEGRRVWVALYYNSDPDERVKLENCPAAGVIIACELTIGSTALMDIHGDPEFPWHRLRGLDYERLRAEVKEELEEHNGDLDRMKEEEPGPTAQG
jgi:hypothetical protein